MYATVISFIKIADPDIYQLELQAETPINNEPGQYIEIYLPHKNPDDRGEKRFFTVYSSPSEEFLSIVTKIGKKPSSFKKTLLALKANDSINYTEPIGDFILPINKNKPLIFVAGGIGISPIRSIVKHLSLTNQKRLFNIFYSTKTESEIIDKQLFDKYNTHYTLTNPSKDWSGPTGRLNPNLIIDLVRKHPNASIFISGPEPFIKDISKALLDNGIQKNALVTDTFTGY